MPSYAASDWLPPDSSPPPGYRVLCRESSDDNGWVRFLIGLPNALESPPPGYSRFDPAEHASLWETYQLAEHADRTV